MIKKNSKKYEKDDGTMKKNICLCLSVCIILSLCIVPVSAAESWLWPVAGFYNISSGYGQRSSGWHGGIDIDAYGVGNIKDKPVVASKSGTVSAYSGCSHNYPKTNGVKNCGCNGDAGNYVSIRHSDGTTSRYLHLGSIVVSNGASVAQGAVIGYVGSTGYSTGYHLHFDISDSSNNRMNPMPVSSKHTTVGNSAPKSKSIDYIYSVGEVQQPAQSPAPIDTPHISNTSLIIKYGQSGDHVRELQECLNHLENAGLKIDGKFGDATHTAVKNFQAKHGLSVDGDAGPKTLGKINELIRAQSTVHNHFEKLAGKNYESAHPHRVYATCICGEEWRYTGETQKVNGCSECYHTHSYTKKYESEHPHKQYAICDCGDKNYTGKTRTVDGCDDCHEHSYITKYEGEHPHKQYKICDCGEKNYTGKTREVKSCEICNPSVKRVIKLQIGVPSMYIDGVEAEIDPGRGTSAILYGGRTLLPIRAIAESFGASVVWDEIEQRVTIYSEDTTIQLWIDEYKAKVNSVTRTVDVAPMLVNGRTFMPIRFIAESLGLSVGWNDANQMVTIEGEI